MVLAILAFARGAAACDAVVSPAAPILEGDPVQIDVEPWPPTSTAAFCAPTERVVTGNSVSIVLHATTRCAQSSPVPVCDPILGRLHATVDLGSLPAGTCDVSIQTDRATFFGASLRDSARLSFTVVPARVRDLRVMRDGPRRPLGSNAAGPDAPGRLKPLRARPCVSPRPARPAGRRQFARVRAVRDRPRWPRVDDLRRAGPGRTGMVRSSLSIRSADRCGPNASDDRESIP